jgi:translation initiation factor IF-1
MGHSALADTSGSIRVNIRIRLLRGDRVPDSLRILTKIGLP